MSFRSLSGWAAAVPVAASLLLAGAAVPAAATGGTTHTEQIRQKLPIIAEEFQHGDCPTVPAGKDGWHFVLPGSDAKTVFTKLTLTFEPGGEQVITTFGPPSDKHAYAASEPGAKLVSAVAETEGEDVKYFNLSHTCPATAAPGEPGEENPGEENPGEENPGGEQPGEENPGGEQPGEENPGGEQPGEENPGGEQPGEGTEGASGEPTQSPSGQPEAGGSASPAPVEGDLAETGAGTTIGLGFAAVLLLAAGGVIVARNRQAGAGN
jgi:hypothetical protein